MKAIEVYSRINTLLEDEGGGISAGITSPSIAASVPENALAVTALYHNEDIPENKEELIYAKESLFKELLDSNVEFKKINDSNSDTDYIFSIGEYTYIVEFSNMQEYDEITGNNTWSLVFYIREVAAALDPQQDAFEKYKATDTGNAAKVFSTLYKIIKEFIKTHKYCNIWFAAETTEPSRIELYDFLIKRLVNKEDMLSSREEHQHQIEYTLIPRYKEEEKDLIVRESISKELAVPFRVLDDENYKFTTDNETFAVGFNFDTDFNTSSVIFYPMSAKGEGYGKYKAKPRSSLKQAAIVFATVGLIILDYIKYHDYVKAIKISAGKELSERNRSPLYSRLVKQLAAEVNGRVEIISDDEYSTEFALILKESVGNLASYEDIANKEKLNSQLQIEYNESIQKIWMPVAKILLKAAELDLLTYEKWQKIENVKVYFGRYISDTYYFIFKTNKEILKIEVNTEDSYITKSIKVFKEPIYDETQIEKVKEVLLVLKLAISDILDKKTKSLDYKKGLRDLTNLSFEEKKLRESRAISTISFKFPNNLVGVSDIHNQSQIAGVLNSFGRGVVGSNGEVRIGAIGTSHVGLSQGLGDAKRFYWGLKREGDKPGIVYVVSKNAMDDDFLKKKDVLQQILSQIFNQLKLSVANGGLRFTESSIRVPKKMYHATSKARYKKIKIEGLRPNAKKVWNFSDNFVYLAFDPYEAEDFAAAAEEAPDSYIDNIIILEVDTTNLDKNKFDYDTNNGAASLQYDGVIPSQYISLWKKPNDEFNESMRIKELFDSKVNVRFEWQYSDSKKALYTFAVDRNEEIVDSPKLFKRMTGTKKLIPLDPNDKINYTVTIQIGSEKDNLSKEFKNIRYDDVGFIAHVGKKLNSFVSNETGDINSVLGLGDPAVVFSGVAKAIDMHLKKHPYASISFATKEESRNRLYLVFAKRIAAKYNMSLNAYKKNNKEIYVFYLTNLKAVKSNERYKNREFNREDESLVKQFLNSYLEDTQYKLIDDKMDKKLVVNNFKKWFGNSQVVDKQGKPKVVYHGTNKEIEEFETEAHIGITSFGLMGNFKTTRLGAYFSENKAFAEDYGPIIYKCFLRVENPLDLSIRDAILDFSEYLTSKGKTKLAFTTRYLQAPWQLLDDEFIADFKEFCDANKYDGVFFYEETNGIEGKTWVIFDPNQVKSAVNNNGSFGLNSDNIKESRLLEILDSNIEVEEGINNSYYFNTVDDSIAYEVFFKNESNYYEIPFLYDISFTAFTSSEEDSEEDGKLSQINKNGNAYAYALQDTGHVGEVFSGLTKCIELFLQKNPKASLLFSAEEESRKVLYSRFAKLLAKKFNFTLSIRSLNDDTEEFEDYKPGNNENAALFFLIKNNLSGENN